MLRLLLAAGAASAEEWPCRLSKWSGILKCDFGTGTRLRDCPGSRDECALSDDQWAALGRQAKDLDTLGSAATEGACTVTCRMCDSWRKKWWSTSAYTVTCLQPNAETFHLAAIFYNSYYSGAKRFECRNDAKPYPVRCMKNGILTEHKQKLTYNRAKAFCEKRGAKLTSKGHWQAKFDNGSDRYTAAWTDEPCSVKPCDKLDIKSVVIKGARTGYKYRHGAFGRKKMECKSGYQMNKSFKYVKCDGTKFVIKFQGQDEQEVSNSVSPCEKVTTTTTTTTTTVKLVEPCENELQQCGRGFEMYQQEDDPFFVYQECVLDACKEVAGKSCESSGWAKAAHDAPPTCAHPHDETPAPGAVCRNGVWWIAKHGKEVPASKFSEICKTFCGGNWGSRGKVLFGQPALCEGTGTPSGWTCGDDLFFVKGNDRVKWFDETQRDCAGSTRLLRGGN